MIFRVLNCCLVGLKKHIPSRQEILSHPDLIWSKKNVISFPTTEPLDAIGV